MTEPFVVTFWGVRGSYPAPGPETTRVGGNTPCLHVRVGPHQLLFDAGTGVIKLGRQLVAESRSSRQPVDLTLFLTHIHHDHTQGFPFFAPARLQTTNLHIFGPKSLNANLQEALADAMLPPVFPITLDTLPCRRVVRNLNAGELVFFNGKEREPHVIWSERDAEQIPPNAVVIRVLNSYAHPQGVYVYRVDFDGRSFVLATDVEGYSGGDEELIRFSRRADLLIHDAQYTEEEYHDSETPLQGWGHSTWRMAVETANRAGVKQLALFHHEPQHDDGKLAAIEREACVIRPNTFLACEGMRVEL